MMKMQVGDVYKGNRAMDGQILEVLYIRTDVARVKDLSYGGECFVSSAMMQANIDLGLLVKKEAD